MIYSHIICHRHPNEDGLLSSLVPLKCFFLILSQCHITPHHGLGFPEIRTSAGAQRPGTSLRDLAWIGILGVAPLGGGGVL